MRLLRPASWTGLLVCGLAACEQHPSERTEQRRTVASQTWQASEVPTPALSDRAVTDQVERLILLDQTVPLNPLDLQTESGVVTISGQLDNLPAKQRAVRLAETVRGVRELVDRTEVGPQALDDAQVEDVVRQALGSCPAIDANQLGVSVAQGVVTLTGALGSWQEKELAGEVTARLRGVRGLRNEIQIGAAAARSDDEIREEVDDALRWSALVDDGLINVSVLDKTVHLAGTVGSAAEKRQAAELARVAGGMHVDTSGLEVRFWARDEHLRRDKYGSESDPAIRNAIEAAMRRHPRVRPFEVTALVSDGAVTLRGSVDNLQAKREAEAQARQIVGVKRVENLIKVRPPPDLTDAVIAQRLQQALQRDCSAHVRQVEADVRDGTVHLTGRVLNHLERARADEVAAQTRGVSLVVNQLQVPRGIRAPVYNPYLHEPFVANAPWHGRLPERTLRSDEEIAQGIARELWWNPFVDAEEIKVEVHHGLATLVGAVDSSIEHGAAVQSALRGGAVGINNEMDVR